jgi:cytochrome o ubiquinol oxidase subunit 2
VWNAFFVPQMGSMIYTMPRMTTQLNLQADKPGTYNGLSSHFSGDGFPGMQFQVQALPADQFAMWSQNAHASQLKLDGAGYAELSKPSSYVKPMTYGAVAPGLFDAIVANRAPQLHLPQAAPPAKQASAVPAGG